jgi:DNA-binding NarL/FixJ family response regulator/class 3 adenylate cyclase
MAELPKGQVTLLFTDVEGSTGLVQRLGADYGAALEEHRRLVREAVQSAGGMVIDTRGDECSSVFLQPEDAIRAAVTALLTLGEYDWQQGGEFRVRVGIHTGEPEIANGSYYGLDVHRVARILAAGHGGQVLVSEATHDLVSSAGFEFRELGTYRLRGLEEPERIFQVVAPGLAPEFPALRLDGGAAEEDGGPRLGVVLAEDSVLLREGIARLLEDAGFDVVGQAGDAGELMLKVRSYQPDIAIVDIRMPPTHTDEGLQAAREIREKHPATGVLVLSQYLEPAYALELLSESAEGVGYLLKDRVADVDGFVEAVRRVAGGGSALDPAVVSQLVGRQRQNDPLGELTPREREVLELMAEGKSNAAIAAQLVVTERAVEKHVTSIFSKLRLPASHDAHRRVLAVLTYLRTE